MANKTQVPEPEDGLEFIDVHCHLPFPRSKNVDLPSNKKQIANFFDLGGCYLVTSTVDNDTLKMTLDFMKKYGKGFNYGFTCGWAPQTVTYTPEKDYQEEWKKWINYVMKNHDEFLAVGEIGLDFHHGKTLEKRKKQVEELEKIIDKTKELNKPYVLHVRNAARHEIDKSHPKHRFNKEDGATQEALRILDEYRIEPERVMFHCFSGPEKYGLSLPHKGYMLSVPSSAYGGNRWRNNTKNSPLDKLVTETDSYYQHPYKRGPVNVPSNVRYSIAAIAFSHGLSQKEVSKKTVQNALEFFNISI